MTKWAHQPRALAAIAEAHTRVKRVCCVVPTGGGKSVIGRTYAASKPPESRGLMLAHRIELLRQFRGHLASVGIDAGIIAPEEPAEPWKRVQCASMDTLVARGEVPEADWVIVDETHHIVADTWRPIIDAQPEAEVLGLTATPQRGDGRPLGDVYGALIVGAQYSELLRVGTLVPCRVFRPERALGSDLAQDPLDAWLAHAGQRQGFAFCRSVKDAKELAERMTAAGIPARCVEGKMSARAREEAIELFSAGKLLCLTNVHVLTEGVDIPAAEVCMLVSAPQHAGTYLQRVGRVLRSAPGKREARLIDLCGVSHEHGLPTADREYALEGRAIRTTGESLRNCPECGCTNPSVLRACAECGHEFPRRVYKGPKLWNLELLEYFENVGELTTAPRTLKRAEWDRLVEVCRGKDFGFGFAVQEFEKVFGERPVDGWMKEFGDDDRLRELRRLARIRETKALRVGWISHAYKATFGAFPSRALREAAGVPVPSQEERAW